MMNLSFHLENSFSCWTHMTPFLRQESLPSRLEPCSELSVSEGDLRVRVIQLTNILTPGSRIQPFVVINLLVFFI